MKKLIFTLIIFLAAYTAFAQAPNKMSYQAVVRDANNALVANSNIGMQISILQGSPTGTTVYAETQTPVSNDNGLVSIKIGTGTVIIGNMAKIDWSVGPYFIQTETDPMGGTAYSITATSELMSVPYAMQSSRADSATFANTADLAGTAIIANNAHQATTAGSAGSATYAQYTDSANVAAFAYNAGVATNATNATNAINAQVADSAAVAKFAYDTPTRRRSFTVTPGMLSTDFLTGATKTKLWYSVAYYPAVNLPDASTSDVKLSFSMPADYAGGPITAKILYVSTATTGTFDCGLYHRGVLGGQSLNFGQGGGVIQLPAPSATNILGEVTVNLSFGINTNTDFVNAVFRRNGGSTTDTSTGILRVIAWVFEYDAK